MQMIDGFIARHGLDAPVEDVPEPRDGFVQPIVEELNLRVTGISSIVWAIGYGFDYSLVRLPVVDDDGFPRQERGVTDYPGLYFVGMPWMPSERSGFLLGVGDAAGHVVSHLTGTRTGRAQAGKRTAAVAL